VKLRAKIRKEFLDQILEGKKKGEIRQIESIVLECEGKNTSLKLST